MADSAKEWFQIAPRELTLGELLEGILGLSRHGVPFEVASTQRGGLKVTSKTMLSILELIHYLRGTGWAMSIAAQTSPLINVYCLVYKAPTVHPTFHEAQQPERLPKDKMDKLPRVWRRILADMSLDGTADVTITVSENGDTCVIEMPSVVSHMTNLQWIASNEEYVENVFLSCVDLSRAPHELCTPRLTLVLKSEYASSAYADMSAKNHDEPARKA
jgi:hypothetical protein